MLQRFADPAAVEAETELVRHLSKRGRRGPSCRALLCARRRRQKTDACAGATLALSRTQLCQFLIGPAPSVVGV
jgi:hypothetical protein